MKIIAVLLMLVSIVSTVYGQENTRAYEFYSIKNQRTVRLKSNTELTLHMKPVVEQFVNDTVFYSTYGLLINKQSDSISLNVAVKYKKVQYSADSLCEYYQKFSYDNPQTFDLKMVNYASYPYKIKPIVEVATFVSIITLVAIAPLRAYDIRNNTFYGDTYLRIAKPAALASIIMLPIYFNLDERKVRVLPTK